MPSPRVVIAMSGGVDSSVAAALLLDRGYDVIGIMLRLWSEPGKKTYNRCCTPDSLAMARQIAQKIGIQFFAVDTQEIFHDAVVNYFYDGYAKGATPNPCLVCNQFIRWDFLLKHAKMLNADYLATGHYARLRQTGKESFELLRAVDLNKDQSYVLHTLGQEQLRQTLFPLGEFTKSEVRQFARDYSLPVADRIDSQDLCFLAGDDYRQFLVRNRPELEKPGTILDIAGAEIGVHNGLAFYTIGQRKGLGISANTPLYVLEKDMNNNTLIVGPKSELGCAEFNTGQANWISGEFPGSMNRILVKIRYKSPEVPANINTLEDGGLRIVLDKPLLDVTPGQAAVFYSGEVCLGGAIIQEVLK